MKNQLVRSVSDFNNELKLKGFNVFQIEADGNATSMYSRKDYLPAAKDIPVQEKFLALCEQITGVRFDDKQVLLQDNL